MEVALQLGTDEVGQRHAREALLGRSQEGQQVLAHHSVQGALLGPPSRVARRTAARPDGIWNFGEWDCGTGGHPPWVSDNRTR